MITYIYFVKCPNCEDEHFDFFDEAKCYAMGRLGQKPIITQTEVNRNDFGECTDHCDLGTVWSWEDVVGKDFVAEPVEQVFTKDDLKNLPMDNDPEFDSEDNDFRFINEELLEGRSISNNEEDRKEFFKLCKETGMITAADLDRFMKDHDANDSNLLDKLRDYKAELDSVDIEESCERKPIPEGMTIEDLVEEMEKNEDDVECTWCNDLFDKSECRYEVDLGWLCSRCEMAIKSRGETLTFREGNYWDFLDEDFEGEYSEADLEEIAADLISGAEELLQDCPVVEDTLVEGDVHIDNRRKPQYTGSWLERVKQWFDDKVISLFIKNEKLYNEVCDNPLNGHLVKEAVLDLVEHVQQLDFERIELLAKAESKKQGINTDNLVLSVRTKEYFIGGYRREVLADRVIQMIRSGKAKDIYDAVQQLDAEMFNFGLMPEPSIREAVKEAEAVHDLGNTYDGGYPGKHTWICYLNGKEVGTVEAATEDEAYHEMEKSWNINNEDAQVIPAEDDIENISVLEELEDAETYRSRLTLCPECGDEHSYDKETSFCINCGFN